MRANSLIFRQLFEPVSSTYSYLLGCQKTRKAVLIDPVLETVDRDSTLVKQLGLELIFGINTHVHADHVTGTGELKKRFPSMHSVLYKHAGGKADVLVVDQEIIKFGDEKLEVRSTPGHTNGCLTYVSHQQRMAFTGDALLIRGCGRTDFQEGSSKILYQSVHKQIFSLPDDYLLYPAHDYNGNTVSSVQEEKQFNPRLTCDEARFIEIMANLNLPYPRQIDTALPANKVCGVYELMDQETREHVFVKQSHR